MDNSELTASIDRYCSAWEDRSREERQELLSDILEPDMVYVDPSVHTEGLAALLDHIATVQARFPGSTTPRLGKVDQHHGLARFAWCKQLADGTRLPAGTDIVEFSPRGRIARIIGFFGPLDGAV